MKAEAAKYAIQEEDVLTYAMFPQVAPKFFEKRNAKAQGVDADLSLIHILCARKRTVHLLNGQDRRTKTG